MYRVAVEYILGLRISGDTLLVAPVIPRAWSKFEAVIRHGSATYNIIVENPDSQCGGVVSAFLDGQTVEFRTGIALAKDGANHAIRIVLGAPRKVTK